MPGIKDPDKDIVTMKIILGPAMIFMSYKDGTFEIKRHNTTEALVGTYLIKVRAEDSKGAKIETLITLVVYSDGADKNSDFIVRNYMGKCLTNLKFEDWDWCERWKEAYNSPKNYQPVPPDVRIKSISKKGEVVL